MASKIQRNIQRAAELCDIHDGLLEDLLSSSKTVFALYGQAVKEFTSVELSPEGQVEKQGLEQMLVLAKSMKQASLTAEIQGKIDGLSDALTRAEDMFKAAQTNGAVMGNKAYVTGHVLRLDFKGAMVSYRFVSLTPTAWVVYTRNPATHSMETVLDSKDIKLTSADATKQVTSPTRARVLCQYCHKMYQSTDLNALGSVTSLLDNGWKDSKSAGGIGKTDTYRYGSYALLLQEDAKSYNLMVQKALIGKGLYPVEVLVRQDPESEETPE